MRAFITGATGLVGRHLARQLVEHGWSVSAIIRETSDPSALKSLGVKLYVCDLSRDRPSPEMLRDADVAFHLAAAVRDWAPQTYFFDHTVQATQRVCDAMVAAGCKRLVHMSTVGVYGVPHRGELVTEDHQLGNLRGWNYYRTSKIRSEEIAWQQHISQRLQVTVLRPGMVYGNGDRTMVGQVASLLRRRKLVFMGDPRVPLPLIHAEDLATAAIAAATCGRAVGEAFNVVNPEIVTQEQFFNTIASLVGAPLVTRHVPYRLAYTLGLAAEIAGHLFMSKHAPPVTRYRVFLFGYRRAYSVQKIQQLLSWQPRIAFADGIRQTAAWYRSQNHS